MRACIAIGFAALATLSLPACAPGTAPQLPTRISLKAQNAFTLEDISDVKCKVHVGSAITEVTLPAMLQITPGPGDILRMECTREGYAVKGIFGGIQQPISRKWLARQPAKCAFISTAILGEGFIGLPLAVLTKHWLPIALIPVGSSLYALHIYSSSGPIPEGNTYLRTDISIYMATPEELTKGDSTLFNWQAQPNEPTYDCPA